MHLRSHISRIITKRYPVFLMAGWTLLIAISMVFTLYAEHKSNLQEAMVEARTYFELNRAYRQWGAKLGGVYASADKVAPNPYLMVPDRDVQTTDGKSLTLVNPAYMTKMVFEMVEKSSPLPVISKIRSLNSINPSNVPDTWERAMLTAFEQGGQEASEITTLGGRPYLRILKPFITEAGCLRCHGIQGYKVGDIRGGISIAVPLQPYIDSERKQMTIVLLTHLLLWLVGSGGLFVFVRIKTRQDRQLSESEWKFRTLSESATAWEFWLDEKFQIIYMSPSSRDLTGYSPEEFTGEQNLLEQVIHPEDREQWTGHIVDFRSPQHDELQFRIKGKDGEVRWISHVCSPVFNGKVFLGRRSSNRDITRQRHLEEQLRQAQKMEAIGTLAGGVAHDFNNILTAIIGYGNLLQRKIGVEDPLRTHVDVILSSADKAAHLTQTLLTFSRKQVMHPQAVDANAIVRNIEKLLLRLIGEDIELETVLSPDDLVIMADCGQIEQVLMNLATNARDAMPDGGRLTISTERVEYYSNILASPPAPKPGSYALISVSDTGKGIEKADLEKIFEPFFTTKEVGRGTGLGLAISYGIIQQHGGCINVYSEPEQGTVFRIYLPLITKQADALPVVNLEQPQTGTEAILVAEDNADVRRLISTVLEGAGYTVVEAVDGEDAVRRLHDFGGVIDLLVLDAIMPKKSGKEALDEISLTNPGIKVLFLSGYNADFIYQKGFIDHAADFLSKPVSPNKLLKKVREILDRLPDTA
ncbi:MAG: hypothetical protein C0402_07945 [Thermodesulfovibrio sp.]|nr:hypothetical protein [Thermodesulfovibrio sp.]